MKKYKLLYIVFNTFLIIIVLLSNITLGCKDIIACGESTAGDYNLLLKVRDPADLDYRYYV